MKKRNEYTCPLELTHDIVKGKWKPIILWQLGKGAKQPSELEKQILNINQKMLLEQLDELLQDGMVEKRIYDGYPLKTQYDLTQRGEKMLAAITIMQGIGVDIMKENGMDDVLRTIDLAEGYTQKSM